MSWSSCVTTSSDVGRDDATDIDLFRAYRREPTRAARNALVERHMGLAYHLTSRYRDRGTSHEDLKQIALLGLVKAVERFDPDHGTAFATFARPFIVGEMRHHFRDQTWDVAVPRTLKDRGQQVRTAIRHLTAELGAEPTHRQIAEHLDLTVDEVIEALDASRARRADSLSRPADPERPIDPPAPVDMTGRIHDGLLLEQLLSDLDDREALIVRRRFVDEWSQQQIADEIGVSQMQVSRLLRSILADLKSRAADSLPLRTGAPADVR